jgi:hypothetical protein
MWGRSTKPVNWMDGKSAFQLNQLRFQISFGGFKSVRIGLNGMQERWMTYLRQSILHLTNTTAYFRKVRRMLDCRLHRGHEVQRRELLSHTVQWSSSPICSRGCCQQKCRCGNGKQAVISLKFLFYLMIYLKISKYTPLHSFSSKTSQADGVHECTTKDST